MGVRSGRGSASGRGSGLRGSGRGSGGGVVGGNGRERKSLKNACLCLFRDPAFEVCYLLFFDLLIYKWGMSSKDMCHLYLIADKTNLHLFT